MGYVSCHATVIKPCKNEVLFHSVAACFEIEPVPQKTWKSRFLASCKIQGGDPRVKKFFSSSFSWIYTNQNFFTFRHKTEKKFLYFFVGFHESELFMTFKQKGTKNFFPYEVVSLCYIWQYQFIMLHIKSSQTVSSQVKNHHTPRFLTISHHSRKSKITKIYYFDEKYQFFLYQILKYFVI